MRAGLYDPSMRICDLTETDGGPARLQQPAVLPWPPAGQPQPRALTSVRGEGVQSSRVLMNLPRTLTRCGDEGCPRARSLMPRRPIFSANGQASGSFVSVLAFWCFSTANWRREDVPIYKASGERQVIVGRGPWFPRAPQKITKSHSPSQRL